MRLALGREDPFLDGNGQVGQLFVMYYDHLLAVSQRGKWEEWLRFFLRGIGAQAQDRVFRMTQLEGIHARYEELALADRNPQRITAMIDFMFLHPILTLWQLESALDMPYMAANRYVDKLWKQRVE